MPMKKATIFWCTGMSGAGKSTLASYAFDKLKERGLQVYILDGDVVRENYDIQLGFGREDVERNNLNVARLCEIERGNYDIIIVPIISPIDIVRLAVRKLLSPEYYLIYIEANIDSLRKRDPKGLYEKAEKGEILDLIGYSDSNPYHIPTDADFVIDTSNSHEVEKSKKKFLNFLLKSVIASDTFL